MTLRVGEILNHRYRIIKSLGKGGFGNVYRAEDTSLKTHCALKENLEYWDVAQRQFEREAIMLAGLRHPNLPRVTDYFIIPAQGQYLVMDFIEGYDLQTVLDRIGKPLIEMQVINWIDQICSALEYLHAQEPPIIHRDIKPANIRISQSRQAILVDFGIAKMYTPHTQTTSGARAVTAGYSPVEQYGEDETSTRSDIYSLGATLYTLLTAERPPESIARVTGKPLIKPTELNTDLSPEIEAVVIKAMHILANARFASVTEFRSALRQAALAMKGKTKKPDRPVLPEGKNPSGPGSRSKPSSKAMRSTPGQATARNSASVGGKPVAVRLGQKATAPRRSVVEIEWVAIPEGDFLYGEDKRKTHLSSFQIAKYPVTNRQYKIFLDANPRYPAPQYWQGRKPPIKKHNHPVVGVNYDDTLAFCAWANCRLPTEREWEKAARGDDGRSYPWGDIWQDGKYCNNLDARIGGTSPVDKYPDGVSPYGVWDMAGNVWEWTDSEYQGPFMHVLRGGSWRLFGGFAVRIVQRDGLTADDWRDDLGFRCARSV